MGESGHPIFFFRGVSDDLRLPHKMWEHFRSPHKSHVASSLPWLKLTAISLINSAVDTVLKSAGFSQLLSKQLVFMAAWQTSPMWRMSPRLPPRTYNSHDAELPFKDMRALFRVSWVVKFSYTGVLFLIIPHVYGEMHANWQIGLELFYLLWAFVYLVLGKNIIF